ncbi:Guanosine-diphosphatase [Chytridiales sp. JEL 0842]|nr:Guanosine-diphosphatase [Chytridiales sp. JEL 0842]
MFIAFVAIIGLFWFFIASGSRSAKDGVDSVVKKPNKSSNNKMSKPSKCTPHPGRPDIQYALMLDAGSTGSRIHVYSFNYCNGASPSLVDEVFHQIKPGLSSYSDSPDDAAKSLDELMEVALKHVPQKYQSCTPVAVKATAGLRLLGNEKSNAILTAVKYRLETRYPFHLIKKDGVVVMDGKDEGVYAWITVNYLLEKIGGSRLPTAAIMDLGGGSTQIVFEPTPKTPMKPGDHKYEVKFGGHSYILYQHSYLGYGLMEARKKLLQAAVELSNQSSRPKSEIPCLPPGNSLKLKTGDKQVEVHGTTRSNFPTCAQFVSKHLFDKSPDVCKVDPCSWDGVYQPPLDVSFPEENDIYAFSYFYDRTIELGVFGEGDDEGYILTADMIKSLGHTVCSADKERVKKEMLEIIQSEPGICLDLGYIYHLLSTGYEISGTRRLRTAKKIKGVETGWCLGASIAMLDDLMSGSDGSKGVCRTV